MPLLYEIEEALSDWKRCEELARTCMTCARSEVGELVIGGGPVTVGYCSRWYGFLTAADLSEPDQDCWE